MITSAVRKIRVQDVADGLRREIGERKLAEGTPIMSTRELAEHYRVSTLTADRAIGRLVDEGLLYRVRGSGTYVKGAAEVRRDYKLAVGLASEMKFANDSLRNYTECSLNYFRNHRAEVQVIPYCDLSNPEIMKREFGHLDGVLLSGACHDEKTEEILLGFGYPVVMFQRDYIVDSPFHQVTWDYRSAYRDIICRAGEPASRRFLVIYESHRNGKFRAEKFIEMLLATGVREEQIERLEADWTAGCEMANYKLASQAAKQLRGKLVFSSSDILSVVLLNAFDAAGLEACRDYEFVSCDNLEDYGFNPFGEPRMTTVHHPWIQAAEAAAKLLLERIEHPSPHTHIIKIATDLVVRQTGLMN